MATCPNGGGGGDSRHCLAKDDPRRVIPELARWMYGQGWAGGKAGSVSIRSKDKVYASPAAVPIDTIQGGDLRVIALNGDPEATEEVENGTKGRNGLAPNGDVPSSMAKTPLYMRLYQIEGVGAHIHTHSPKAVMATVLFPGKEFQFSNLQAIAGISKCRTWTEHELDDTLVVPIIENATGDRLRGNFQQALADYPDTCAVLIRGHGIYVWGRTWVEAKCMVECYEYVFDIAIEMKKCGLDPTSQLLQSMSPCH